MNLRRRRSQRFWFRPLRRARTAHLAKRKLNRTLSGAESRPSAARPNSHAVGRAAVPLGAAGVDDAAVMNNDTEDVDGKREWPRIYKRPVQPTVGAFGQAAIGADENVRCVLGIKSDPERGRLTNARA